MVTVLAVFCTAFAAYDKSGTIKVRKKKDYSVYLAGSNGGDLNYLKLCHPDGLYLKASGIKIISFEFSIPSVNDYTQSIKGNRLTGSACDRVQMLRNGDLVFFNAIVGQDETGRTFPMPSLRFKVLKNEVEDDGDEAEGKN